MEGAVLKAATNYIDMAMLRAASVRFVSKLAGVEKMAALAAAEQRGLLHSGLISFFLSRLCLPARKGTVVWSRLK